MAIVYKCDSCNLHYCADCDGGMDQCATCKREPLCDECAVDHVREHKAEEDPSDED